LSSLALAVRVDRAGRTIRDYHTVGGDYPKESRVKTAEGRERTESASTVVTERFYLVDAAFTVTLTGYDQVIEAAARAVQAPRWALSLGRRSCPPGHPFFLDVIDSDPIEHLQDVLPVVRDLERTKNRTVDFIVDDPMGASLGFRDLPTRELNKRSTYAERKVLRWGQELPDTRFVGSVMDLWELGVASA